ncbi:sporulation-delaying protein SdpB family protein [Lentzea sp. NPDC051838]|uniref:sporulation-delaying protein SdpB family protein n=1 Tax=Lentzea sp. NPDC051838 TaxID=3154849 RepID=UPI00342759CC
MLNRLLAADPRSPLLGAARSLVAAAQLLTLMSTSDTGLFPGLDGAPDGPLCTGLRATSLWCLGFDPVIPRWTAIVVLLAVASGYRPKWTCVPHWYVAFSFTAALIAPNGGEHISKILALLLIPMLLGDDRRWHWTQPRTPMSPRWHGAAVASHLAIRAQVAYVYGSAVWFKLREPEWRSRDAMHYAMQDAYFGATPAIAELIDGVGPVLTWGTIAAEAFLAVSAFCGLRIRRWAVLVGAALHAGILVVLGLVGFGLVMVGLLLASASRSSSPADP